MKAAARHFLLPALFCLCAFSARAQSTTQPPLYYAVFAVENGNEETFALYEISNGKAQNFPSIKVVLNRITSLSAANSAFILGASLAMDGQTPLLALSFGNVALYSPNAHRDLHLLSPTSRRTLSISDTARFHPFDQSSFLIYDAANSGKELTLADTQSISTYPLQTGGGMKDPQLRCLGNGLFALFGLQTLELYRLEGQPLQPVLLDRITGSDVLDVISDGTYAAVIRRNSTTGMIASTTVSIDPADLQQHSLAQQLQTGKSIDLQPQPSTPLTAVGLSYSGTGGKLSFRINGRLGDDLEIYDLYNNGQRFPSTSSQAYFSKQGSLPSNISVLSDAFVWNQAPKAATRNSNPQAIGGILQKAFSKGFGKQLRKVLSKSAAAASNAAQVSAAQAHIEAPTEGLSASYVVPGQPDASESAPVAAPAFTGSTLKIIPNLEKAYAGHSWISESGKTHFVLHNALSENEKIFDLEAARLFSVPRAELISQDVITDANGSPTWLLIAGDVSKPKRFPDVLWMATDVPGKGQQHKAIAKLKHNDPQVLALSQRHALVFDGPDVHLVDNYGAIFFRAKAAKLSMRNKLLKVRRLNATTVALLYPDDLILLGIDLDDPNDLKLNVQNEFRNREVQAFADFAIDAQHACLLFANGSRYSVKRFDYTNPQGLQELTKHDLSISAPTPPQLYNMGGDGRLWLRDGDALIEVPSTPGNDPQRYSKYFNLSQFFATQNTGSKLKLQGGGGLLATEMLSTNKYAAQASHGIEFRAFGNASLTETLSRLKNIVRMPPLDPQQDPKLIAAFIELLMYRENKTRRPNDKLQFPTFMKAGDLVQLMKHLDNVDKLWSPRKLDAKHFTNLGFRLDPWGDFMAGDPDLEISKMSFLKAFQDGLEEAKNCGKRLAP